MPAPFTPETYTFLRGLKRHNDREWFNARKAVYERAIKAPTLACIEQINAALCTFAPDYTRPANKIAMRIYRDTRFSLNKVPYKTHIAAWWAQRGMEKTSGGGWYLQIAPDGILFAAGVYMPERDQLRSLREWMSRHHSAYRAQLKKLTANKTLAFAAIDPQALTRMPKGFAANDPADDLVRAKNWGVRSALPADAALTATFAQHIVKRMKVTLPLVETLNQAILQGAADEPTNSPPRSARGLANFF